MLSENALISIDHIETISNVTVMLEGYSSALKALARHFESNELMALSMSCNNSCFALRTVEALIEKGGVREPGVDQITPATP